MVEEQGATAQYLCLMTRVIEQANSKVTAPPPPTFVNSNSMYTINNLLCYIDLMLQRFSNLKIFLGYQHCNHLCRCKIALLAIVPIHTAYNVKQCLAKTQWMIQAVCFKPNLSLQLDYIESTSILLLFSKTGGGSIWTQGQPKTDNKKQH